MGNCVTSYKNKDPADMDLSVRIQSPIKENNVGSEPSIDGCDPRPQLSSKEQETSFLDMGKTEESFFDSKPWLDSDCEDFFSVNGDSTSSTGNSPNHQKSIRESSIPDKNHSMDRAENAVPAQATTDTKKPVKQLIELFRESLNDDGDDDLSLKQQLENKPSTFSLPPKSPSSETTPYGGYLPRKDKQDQSAQCCLPSLVRNMSFGDRKKRLSPAQTDG